MEVESEAFVNSLAGFTLLGSFEQMKWKNLEAIRVLLDIAQLVFIYKPDSSLIY